MTGQKGKMEGNMKLLIVGAPASGKTWLAKHLADELHLNLIEADDFFWKGKKELPLEKFRLAIREQLAQDAWVFEGHATKLIDILISQNPKLIVIDEKPLVEFRRMAIRDILHSKKLLFQVKNYRELKKRRSELVGRFEKETGVKAIRWDGRKTSLKNLLRRLKT
jgi:adenylate kinase family enzyme